MELDYALHRDPAWVGWNEAEFGLASEHHRFEGKRFVLEAILYRDRRGRLVQPPLNTYLAARFVDAEPTPGRPPTQRLLSEEWFDLGARLAEVIRDGRPSGHLALPPTFQDVRPFVWAGLSAVPRYTYTTALAGELDGVSRAIAQKRKKALRAGYTVTHEVDAAAVFDCLEATARAQGFTWSVPAGTFERLERALGPEKLLKQAVTAPDGRVVSAGMRLVAPGTTGIDWVQGTERDALGDGVAQLIQWEVLDALRRMGATSFDFGGADMRPVAIAKSSWNMPLTTYYRLELPSLADRGARRARTAVRPVRVALQRSIQRVRRNVP